MDMFFELIFLDPANWVQYLFAAFFAALVLCADRQKEEPWLPFLLKFVGLLLLTVLVYWLFNFGFTMLAQHLLPGLGGLGDFLVYLVGVLFLALFSRQDWRARWINVVCVYATTLIVIQFGFAMGSVLEFNIEGFNSLYTKITAILLLVPAAIILKKHPISRYPISDSALTSNFVSGTVAVLLVVCYQLLIRNISDRGGLLDFRILAAAALLAMYVVLTSSYLMTYALCREQKTVLRLQAAEQMSKSTASLIAVTENNLDDIHKIRHDIRNQYAYMEALLESKDYDALSEYFEELTGTFATPLYEVFDCGNHDLNVIFHMESAKAQKAGVALDIQAVPPHELPFSPVELCSLYTNVIDNAIEACVREGFNAVGVHVQVSKQGDYLYSKVTNPTARSAQVIRSSIRTSKQDQVLHGHGMAIARKIVSNYNGVMKNRVEDGMFISEFFLDLTGKGGDNE